MQVGFEAKRLFTNFTGLGNYSRFVVSALSEFVPENTYTLYSPEIRSHPEVVTILARPNVKTIGPTGGFKFFKSLWRSWGVSHNPSISALNIFHGLSQELPSGLPTYIKKIVTVHDLIFIRYPKFYNPIDVIIYTEKVKSACRAADKVIAISQQTADDLVEFINVDRSKIQVVYQGCHPIFKRKFSAEEKASVSAKYNLPAQYILNIGTIEKRKNVKLLIEALPLISPHTKIPVVIVGRSTHYKDEVLHRAKELKVSDQLIFIHNASFQDLPGIYQQADIFVYPSLFEGFGIPLVEAVESEVPVISSRGSCFREAAGPDSVYVDSTNKEELAFQIERILSDDNIKQRMIKKASNYIQQFQPEMIAKNLNSLYRQVV